MKIENRSSFKDPVQDTAWFNTWASEIERSNNRKYQRIEVQTSLGKTHIWGINTERKGLEPIVIFPGARTSVLFFDLDKNLDNLSQFRIYLVETNGLPNLSDGATPDIKSPDFGHWANEVLDHLKLEKVFIAGASFGGLICMKLAITNPERVQAAFLLNPGCLQMFSMSLKNLYYNLLPIISPKRKNIIAFLEKAVFCKPNHQLSQKAYDLLVDYELFALTRYNDKTQKPYDMGDELGKVKVDTYLLVGDKDLLFPFEKSIHNGKTRISSLKDVKVFENVAHGIETYAPALQYVSEKTSSYSRVFSE